MRRLASLSFLALLSLLAAPAAAQDVPAPPEDEAQAPGGDERFDAVVLSVGGDAPEAVAREAREAVAATLEGDGLRVYPEGELALRMPPARLRGCDSIACAYRLGRELGVSMVAAVATWSSDGAPSSVTVSLVVAERRAHAATEELGGRTLREAAAAAARGAQDARGRALLVEGSTGAASATEHAGDARETGATEIEPEAPRERPLEEYVLPTILGVVGLGLVAASVYALMPEQCELRGPSGACLRGHGPNVGLGAVFAVTGGLAVAGAILWLIVGGSPPTMGRIDVVLAPDGGGLSWRDSF